LNLENSASTVPRGLHQQLREIFRLVSPAVRLRARLLVIVTLCCSILEAATVGVVVPMISLWMNPDQTTLDSRLLSVLSLAGANSREDVAAAIIFLFILVTLLGGSLRVWLISLSARLASDAGAELAERAFQKILAQKYIYLIQRNSSELISILTEKIGTASGLMLSLLSLFNALLMLGFIWLGLILVDARVTFFSTAFFGLLYTAVIYLTRKRIDHNSSLLSVDSPRFLKNLRETFGSMRDIILSGTQPVYLNSFAALSRKLKTSNAENIVMSQSPRYIVEMVGLTLVALVAQALQGTGSMSRTLPLLGALAIGAQRMLPLVQLIYSAYVNIRLSRKSLIDVLQVMHLPEPAAHELLLVRKQDPVREITFEGVSFRYSPFSTWVIKDLTLRLNSGAHFAVVGPSGMGKSTFLDLLTGLLEPGAGQITVNGIILTHHNMGSWRSGMAYVPQSAFLIDGTIAENVAFGVPKGQIDIDRVQRACRVAEIAEFVESRADAYMAIVGEQGAFMSGGQRQRLGIARAIFRDPDVLILDEATNALDSVTEAKVLSNLHSYKPELTVVHVTHRLDVARDFDFILEFAADNIVNKGTFEELLASSPSFSQLIARSRPVSDY
jgi:ATP-binding cassette subfamily B protein